MNNGANLNIQNEKGETALMIGMYYKFWLKINEKNCSEAI